MQRKKEYIDSRIEEANIDKGIIVLLTGNGKETSTGQLNLGFGIRMLIQMMLSLEVMVYLT